jgi:hypothetical protein
MNNMILMARIFAIVRPFDRDTGEIEGRAISARPL